MAKPQAPIADDAPPPRPRRPLAILLLVALAFAPILYEGGLACVARWAPLFDRRMDVKTPVIDAVAGLVRSGFASLDSSFDQVPWRPEAVGIVGLACFIVCALFLRRK